MITLLEYIPEAESLTVLIDLPYKGSSLFSAAKTHTRHVLLVLSPLHE